MMSRHLLSRVAAVAMVLPAAFAGAAQAAVPGQGCHLRIETATANWVVEGYDPFGTDVAPQATFDVTFVNDGDAPCRFLPRFATDGSTLGLDNGGTGKVAYTLLDMSRGTDATPVAGRTARQANSPYLDIAPGGQQLVRYELKVDPNAIPGDGRFTQRLFLTADDNDRDIASKLLTVGINVRPTAVMALAGQFKRSNGQADVDLGELRQGMIALPLQLHVLSTRAYDLQFVSRNGGKLQLASSSQWSIPYSLLVDDRKADIISGTALSSSPINLVRLDSLPIAFDIGSVDNMRAGTYSDLITISVSVK